MFRDECQIEVIAGKGGDGLVAQRTQPDLVQIRVPCRGIAQRPPQGLRRIPKRGSVHGERRR